MERLKQTLWALPLACVALSLVVAIATSALDHAHPGVVPTVLTGTPSGAQTVLTTIASSMITLITLVLTVVTVAIQLAMAQFSPRIVRTLLRDRSNQLSFGLFGGTAVFTTVAAVQVDDQTGFVPGVTVMVAYALTLASLVALVLYIDRAGQALRVSGLIDLVGDQLHEQLATHHPDRLADLAPPDPFVIPAVSAGSVVRIDEQRLVEQATRAGCVLEVVPAMGEFVPTGGALVRIVGDGTRLDPEELRRLVHLADERTHDTDPAYGFRKLVDIAVRSMTNDPTTAVQAIHRLHDALRALAVAELPDGRHRDAAGELRLLTKELTWDGYVRLAFDEIRLAGASKMQVSRRLRAALEDLRAMSVPARRPILDCELELLDRAVHGAFDSDVDVATALVPDDVGIGAGPDVTRRGR